MGWFSLRSVDGHIFKVFEQVPAEKPAGMVIVLQEIFGVNSHIQAVCQQMALQGWLAVAPALFDRVDGEQALGYTAADIEAGRTKKDQISPTQALRDIEAVFEWGRQHGHKIAVVGFCWGGTLAWLAANRMPLDAVVIYYGTQVAEHLQAMPAMPVLMHFGEMDAHIPPSHVQAIASACPDALIHRYPAGHGFNCDERAAFHQPSAQLAGLRTQEFLAEHLGQR